MGGGPGVMLARHAARRALAGGAPRVRHAHAQVCSGLRAGVFTEELEFALNKLIRCCTLAAGPAADPVQRCPACLKQGLPELSSNPCAQSSTLLTLH
jgi:hypothetical protein